MAFKGTAGKSSTGASMSKYDVEVEERLQKLEKAVAELVKVSHTKCDGTGGGDVAAVEDKLNKVISRLQAAGFARMGT
tara:strand:- start:115 stop:348 length:234 start_codon:yes stop_codon:yes gene_type:complete